MQTMLVTLKRLVLVVGLIFGSHARAGAQSTENRVAFVQSPPSKMIESLPRQAPPFGSSVLLIQHQESFSQSYDFRVATNYELQNLNSLFPFQQTKTSLVTESRLLVAQLWGERLQVNLFAVTLHTGNAMLGPLVTNDAFHRPRQFGAPSSLGLYGIGLSIPLGRDARQEGTTSLWDSLHRIVHGGSPGAIELAHVR